MRVLIGGYYGFDNAGDEAILAAMLADLRALEPGLEATVASGDPSKTTAEHKVPAVHWLDVPALLDAAGAADLVVLGGGGLFQDYWPFDADAVLTPDHRGIAYYAGFAAAAAIAKKPFALYALGVGPLATDAGRSLTRAAVEQAQAVTVRDARSKALLESLGVEAGRIHVTADPAFRLRAAPPERAQAVLEAARLDTAARPRLGLALRQWNVGIEPEAWEGLVAQAADEFLERHGGAAVFVPFHGLTGELQDDVLVAHRVRTRMRHAMRAVVLGAGPAPREKAAVLSSCDLVLGMRLHALVFSMAAGVPSVALAYDPKVAALMDEAGASGHALALGDATAGALADLLGRTWVDRAALAGTFRAAGERLGARAAETAKLVLAAARQPAPAAGELVRKVAGDHVRRLARAEAESAGLRAVTAALAAQLGESDRVLGAQHENLDAISGRLAAIEAHVTAMEATFGAALLRRMRAVRLKAAPGGSRRERALARLLGGVRALNRRRAATAPAGEPIAPAGPEPAAARTAHVADAPVARQIQDLAARLGGTKGAVLFLPSIGWDVDLVQRPHHLARAFARAGHVSVFDVSNDPRETRDGLREVEPGVLLYRGPRELLARIPGGLLWTLPYNYHLRAQHPAGSAVVYDWIDDLSVFEHQHSRAALESNHRAALAEASVVACVARTLHEEARRDRPDALYLPNGVEYDRFALDGAAAPPDDAAFAAAVGAGKPVAGYYGALASWFDYELLGEVSRLRPDWTFVVIGPDLDGSARGQPALAQPNVAWLGPRPYAALPRYLQGFDVATIPFRINAITRSTSPLKLFEYFAGGRPVVTTPMPECMAFPEVRVAATAAEFARALDGARADGRRPGFQDRLRSAGRANSWDARVALILSRLR